MILEMNSNAAAHHSSPVTCWLTDLLTASKIMVCWYTVLGCEMYPDYHLYPESMLPVRHGWILSQLISSGYSQTPCKSLVSFLFANWMSAFLSLMQLRRTEYMYTHRSLYYVHLFNCSLTQIPNQPIHMAATQCIKAHRHAQDDLLKYKPSVRMDKKGDLSVFECSMGVGVRQAEYGEYFRSCWTTGIFMHSHL